MFLLIVGGIFLFSLGLVTGWWIRIRSDIYEQNKNSKNYIKFLYHDGF